MKQEKRIYKNMLKKVLRIEKELNKLKTQLKLNIEFSK